MARLILFSVILILLSCIKSGDNGSSSSSCGEAKSDSPIKVLKPNCGVKFKKGDSIVVLWEADTSQVQNAVVSLSVNNGLDYFSLMATQSTAISVYNKDSSFNRNWGAYGWKVVESIATEDGDTIFTVSDSCRIKVWNPYGNLEEDVSDRLFSISK